MFFCFLTSLYSNKIMVTMYNFGTLKLPQTNMTWLNCVLFLCGSRVGNGVGMMCKA